MIKCPHCKTDLFQRENNKIKLRTNILIFEKSAEGNFNNSGTICKKCKKFISIPIKLDVQDSEMKHIIFEK